MDQEAFRKFLSSSKNTTTTAKQNSAHHARSLLPPKTKDDQKKQSTDSSKSTPSFKPRKVKKDASSGYRDRAAERRLGVAGDFAEVETVLENFEKHHANEDKQTVEEHRKYLGGDAEHSVLVKGLDFALLEQTRARLAASEAAHDDEELEEAFRGVLVGAGSASPPLEQDRLTSGSASASKIKKRTREDIVKELKNKRTKGEGEVDGGLSVEEKSIEEVQKEGKFRPIGSGFKPIGSGSGSFKSNDGKEVKKKKKRKVVGRAENETSAPAAGSTHVETNTAAQIQPSSKEGEPSTSNTTSIRDSSITRPSKPAPEPEPEQINEGFDIFADAGEYEGINLGDEDEDGEDDEDRDGIASERPEPSPEAISAPAPGDKEPFAEELRPTRRKWIEDSDDDAHPSPSASPDREQERSLPSLSDSKGKREERRSPSYPPADELRSRPPQHEVDEAEKSTPPPLTRLVPLTSSSVPSIRDILAADSALEAEQKRKARKEKLLKKRSGGGEGEDESDDDGGKKGNKKKKVNDETKLNREYQKLKSYTAKKGGAGAAGL